MSTWRNFDRLDHVIKENDLSLHCNFQEMPTLVGKLTEKHNEIMAKQEAARLLKEKQEKQRKKNAAKRLAREVRS